MQPESTAVRSLGATRRRLVEEHDSLLVDLDGVVYTGPTALPSVADRLASCRAAGASVGFVTNNASRPPDAVAAHLRQLGIDAEADSIVTSAQAAARLVAEQVPAGARILVVGGEGLVAALAEHGLEAVWSATDHPAAVVQGFHPSLGWELLAEGAYALATGIPWVASNMDRTVPTERGMAPGNGCLVEALRAASGRDPVVAGKPEPALFAEACLRLGGERPLVVGDRIDTDFAGAARSGLPCLAVLTGVSTLAELCAARAEERPTYVGPDLEALLLPHPDVVVNEQGASCAGISAQIEDGAVMLSGTPDTAGAAAALAALRAVVGACWSYEGGRVDTESAGRAIDQFAAHPNASSEEAR